LTTQLGVLQVVSPELGEQAGQIVGHLFLDQPDHAVTVVGLAFLER